MCRGRTAAAAAAAASCKTLQLAAHGKSGRPRLLLMILGAEAPHVLLV